jgi:subtilisin
MAKKRPASPRSNSRKTPNDLQNIEPSQPVTEFTGKYLVLFEEHGVDEGLKKLKSGLGLSDVCHANEFTASALNIQQANQAEIVVLDELKLAVVDIPPSDLSRMNSTVASSPAIMLSEPEQYMYALGSFSLEYLKGYRDGVNQLVESLIELELAPSAAAALASTVSFADTAQLTWGLQATKVNVSNFSGSQIRIAVLDTGFDINGHPDFQGRSIVSQSFIPGQTVQDGNGHGTHCVGSAMGPKIPASGVRRYGCAFNAEIFVGKVLSNAGSGSDQGILAGINWAIANGCRIISMSLGSRVAPGGTHSGIYETIANRALNASPGTLIVAAAGNDSRDPSTGARMSPPAPVSRPANCPSIMAVASLDNKLQVSPFSNGGINSGGGEVNIAGPGSAIFSSVPDPFPPSNQPTGFGRPWPSKHHIISGTSMATPHVAGIAALWLEANPTATARSLWQLLVNNAKQLPLLKQDVGGGLVQAP